jgi:hypothetical protein
VETCNALTLDARVEMQQCLEAGAGLRASGRSLGAFASAQTVAQKLDETLRPPMKKYGVTALKPGGMDMRTPTLVVYAGGWRQCRRALPATVLAATDVVAQPGYIFRCVPVADAGTQPRPARCTSG